MKYIKDFGAIITTVFIFAILIWSLVYVFKFVGTSAELDAQGKVVLDKFGNAKTILLAVLPLATTAVGYWLGNKGAGEAQAKAEKADAQKSAVLDVSQPEILSKAREKHPEAFS